MECEVIGVAERKLLLAGNDLKSVRDSDLGQHLGGRAKPDSMAGMKEQDVVTDTSSQVQVMQGSDDCQRQASDQVQHLKLVTNIEVVGRLVENQKPRLLGERTSHHNPLAFAARQGTQMAANQPPQFEPVQGVFDNDFVSGTSGPADTTPVRRPTQGHDLPDCKGKVTGLFLQDSGNPPGYGLGRQAPDIIAINADGAGCRPVEPVEQTQ